MPDTKRYFEIVEAFNNSKFSHEGTHSLINFVTEYYPEEVEYVVTIIHELSEYMNFQESDKYART
jgi:hypothetical protein